MKTKAELYLLLVAALWGLTFPMVQQSVKHIEPVTFVCVRFFVAALIMLPLLIKGIKHTNLHLLLWCSAIGLLNFLAYTLQTTGLKTISSAESAFITGMSVVFVPILSAVLRIEKSKLIDYLSAFVCLIGLYFLTGSQLGYPSLGELLTLLCAICVALTIILIQLISRRQKNATLIVFYQIITTALFALPFVKIQDLAAVKNSTVLFGILFCALFSTVFTLFLQAKYQRFTTANKTAVIFCAEPLFATLFAWGIYHQYTPLSVLMGGCIILVGMLLPNILRSNVNRP